MTMFDWFSDAEMEAIAAEMGMDVQASNTTGGEGGIGKDSER